MDAISSKKKKEKMEEEIANSLIWKEKDDEDEEKENSCNLETVTMERSWHSYFLCCNRHDRDINLF